MFFIISFFGGCFAPPLEFSCTCNNTFQIGTEYEEEYYSEVSSVINLECKYEYDLSKPVGMKQKLLDSSQINKLGWKPKFSLREGIKSTYEYFISLNKGY